MLFARSIILLFGYNITFSGRAKPAILPGLFRGLVLIILSSLLNACGDQSVSSLSIGANNWIGYQPFYIARELGYFDNSEIKLVELNNATDIMHELLSHQLDGAALTMDEALTLIQQGADMRVVLVVDISNGGDALLSKPDINSIDELKGKYVAVEYTAVGATVLDAALSSADMTIDDINIMHCAWDMHIKCYENADAVVTFEPVKTQLMEQGAKSLFDSSHIKGRIVDVLAIRAEAATSKPDAIRLLINAYFKSLDYMHKQPDQTNQIIEDRTKLNAAQVRTMLNGIEIPGYEGNKDLFNEHKLQDNTVQLVELMVEKQLLESSVAIDQLFDDQYLPD